MGLGVEPGSPGTALNAPPGLHYILHLVGGKWGRGQMDLNLSVEKEWNVRNDPPLPETLHV